MFVMFVALGASACATDDDSASTAADDVGAEEPMTVQAPAEPGGDAAAESAVDTGPTAEPRTVPTPGVPALAIEAGVTVGSSDIRQAVDDTLTVVARHGASVYTADVDIGNERDDGSIDGSGSFVVKVPPADLEPLIDDLGDTVGVVMGRTQDTSNVTDLLVDLEIRIRVERTIIGRYEELLSEATDLSDIVAIESVIAERTIALEQLLASQRNLDDRVERSTLTIDLQYVDPSSAVTPETSDDGIADAWRAGWDVFVGALFAVGFVLAVATPFLLSALVVGAAVWLLVRRSQRRFSPPSSAPGPTVTEPDESLASPSPPR